MSVSIGNKIRIFNFKRSDITFLLLGELRNFHVKVMCGRRKLHSYSGKKTKQNQTSQKVTDLLINPSIIAVAYYHCFEEYLLHLVQEVLNRNLVVLE